MSPEIFESRRKEFEKITRMVFSKIALFNDPSHEHAAVEYVLDELTVMFDKWEDPTYHPCFWINTIRCKVIDYIRKIRGHGKEKKPLVESIDACEDLSCFMCVALYNEYNDKIIEKMVFEETVHQIYSMLPKGIYRDVFIELALPSEKVLRISRERKKGRFKKSERIALEDIARAFHITESRVSQCLVEIRKVVAVYFDRTGTTWRSLVNA